MIQMPQTVALFNGLGGGASALVGLLSVHGETAFVRFTALLAVAVGMVTLVGSLVAAGKLHRVLPQKPVVWKAHAMCTLLFLALTLAFVVTGAFVEGIGLTVCLVGAFVSASLFGLWFSLRVGGADMPITISLLNSLSGVAGSIAGAWPAPSPAWPSATCSWWPSAASSAPPASCSPRSCAGP